MKKQLMQYLSVNHNYLPSENPTAADIARDGFGKEKKMTWDELQKASNAVQPRMFGKQGECIHVSVL